MRKSSFPKRVKRGLSEPHLVVRELNKYFYRHRGPSDDAVDLLQADWDNLLLLDACRYDTFETIHDLPGELESRRNVASSTIEFLHRSFDGADLSDTVYVTANPQLYRKRDRLDLNIFEVNNVWQEEGWDDEYRTVRPETVIDAAMDAAEQYPNKRLLVHFIQPHYPFIGPTGQEHFDLDSLDFWDRVLRGEVDIPDDVLWNAYEENLEVVLPHVETLMEALDGKTVVSADHGEMIGERSSPIPMTEYGHPSEVHTDSLVTVPWLVYHNGDRRDVRAEESTVSMAKEDHEVVEDRLKDLGYA
jgi:hypothetical protein